MGIFNKILGKKGQMSKEGKSLTDEPNVEILKEKGDFVGLMNVLEGNESEVGESAGSALDEIIEALVAFKESRKRSTKKWWETRPISSRECDVCGGQINRYEGYILNTGDITFFRRRYFEERNPLKTASGRLLKKRKIRGSFYDAAAWIVCEDCVSLFYRVGALDDWYLFNIDAELEDDLNKSIIPEKLKEIFKTKGFSFSDNASVTKEKKNEWRITDEKKFKKFIVRKEEGKLNIYDDFYGG